MFTDSVALSISKYMGTKTGQFSSFLRVLSLHKKYYILIHEQVVLSVSYGLWELLLSTLTVQIILPKIWNNVTVVTSHRKTSETVLMFSISI